MDQGLEQSVHSLHELSKPSGIMSNTHCAGLNLRKNLVWKPVFPFFFAATVFILSKGICTKKFVSRVAMRC